MPHAKPDELPHAPRDEIPDALPLRNLLLVSLEVSLSMSLSQNLTASAPRTRSRVMTFVCRMRVSSYLVRRLTTVQRRLC